jgi:hypothetical protein
MLDTQQPCQRCCDTRSGNHCTGIYQSKSCKNEICYVLRAASLAILIVAECSARRHILQIVSSTTKSRGLSSLVRVLMAIRLHGQSAPGLLELVANRSRGSGPQPDSRTRGGKADILQRCEIHGLIPSWIARWQAVSPTPSW